MEHKTEYLLFVMQADRPIDPDEESQTIRTDAGAAASTQIIALREGGEGRGSINASPTFPPDGLNGWPLLSPPAAPLLCALAVISGKSVESCATRKQLSL